MIFRHQSADGNERRSFPSSNSSSSHSTSPNGSNASTAPPTHSGMHRVGTKFGPKMVKYFKIELRGRFQWTNLMFFRNIEFHHVGKQWNFRPQLFEKLETKWRDLTQKICILSVHSAIKELNDFITSKDIWGKSTFSKNYDSSLWWLILVTHYDI